MMSDYLQGHGVQRDGVFFSILRIARWNNPLITDNLIPRQAYSLTPANTSEQDQT
ncbi:hypothetical protein GCM10027295_11110 [Pseudaeromonas pectinilytica]